MKRLSVNKNSSLATVNESPSAYTAYRSHPNRKSILSGGTQRLPDLRVTSSDSSKYNYWIRRR
jgi:hypothetical protein